MDRTIHGIVHGRTIELDRDPGVADGQEVEVIVRPIQAVGSCEDWWKFLQKARKELKASGHRFRTKQEIETEREDFRASDERIEEIQRGGRTPSSEA